MRHLFVIVLAVLVTIAITQPAQSMQIFISADQIDGVMGVVESTCPCETDADINVDVGADALQLMEPPKGDDHTWGGDPDYSDPGEGYWVHYLWYVMNCLFYPGDCDNHNIIY